MGAFGALHRAGPLLGARQRLPSASRHIGAARPIARLPSRRAVLRCTAHAGHDHSHSHAESSHSCCDSHGVGHSCGHDHGGPDLHNPAHRLLKRVYDATGLTPAAAWLESSMPASLGKVALFVLAAAAASYAAGPAAAAGAAAAAAAARVAAAATAGVYLLAGLPAAVDLSYDLTAGKVDTHVLMNLAVLGTLATGHALEGALLLVLFQSSHVVEHLLTHRAQGNLAALYDTMPQAAVLVDLLPDGSPDLGSARRVRASEAAVGAHMLVKPGEQVPLDGAIVHGRAMVSAEHITGESLPVLRRPGDEVAAGSLNRDGVLVLRALRPAEESTPARIAKLTLDAQAQRPQLRTWLDRFGEAYSKAVVAAALGLLLALLASGVPLLGAVGQRGAFYRAMGLLTVASPCALVMVPLAYVSAIAAIASRGILVKGGRVLDALARCSTVAFDKTGTLTTGSLACTSMQALGPVAADGSLATSSSSGNGSGGGGGSTAARLGLPAAEATAAKRRALAAAVALSLRSSHPVSDAVVLHGQSRGVDGSSVAVSDFRLVAGGGVEGLVSSSSGGSSSSGSNSRSSQQQQQEQQHAAFGSLEFVNSRLSQGEARAIERLAAEQGTSSVLSVLVLEPAAEASSSSSSSGSGSSSSSATTSSSSTNGSNGRSGAAAAGGSARSVWVLSFEDSVRQQSAAAVRQLQTGSWTGSASQADRLAVTMLTGDNAASAQRVARKLGIRSVRAALSPEEKLAEVQQLSAHSSSGGSGSSADASGTSRRATRSSSSGSSGGSSGSSGAGRRRQGGVIMVGDGINDAPALAAADVGVAIASSATAAASLAADVIVVNSSGIAAVPAMLRIAQATQAVIRQNLALAAGSILALSLPTVLGWVPLWFAVMLHEGSTLLVALNSLRLLALGAPPRRWQAQQAHQEGAAAAETPARRDDAAPAHAHGSGCGCGGEPAAATLDAVPAAPPAA